MFGWVFVYDEIYLADAQPHILLVHNNRPMAHGRRSLFTEFKTIRSIKQRMNNQKEEEKNTHRKRERERKMK